MKRPNLEIYDGSVEYSDYDGHGVDLEWCISFFLTDVSTINGNYVPLPMLSGDN